MSESDILEAPHINLSKTKSDAAAEIDLSNPAFDEKWRREYIAFIRLLPELLKTHRNKFVAIHGGEVVAVGDTFEEVALKAYARVGYVPMHVTQVTENHVHTVRLPSSRVSRSAVST